VSLPDFETHTSAEFAARATQRNIMHKAATRVIFHLLSMIHTS